MTKPLLLTARDAARTLSICEKHLWNVTYPRGALPCIRIGRAVRYAVRDLEEWIEQQKAASSGNTVAGN
jgi:predicted DNA-binding transcriptional regulator AlpA